MASVLWLLSERILFQSKLMLFRFLNGRLMRLMRSVIVSCSPNEWLTDRFSCKCHFFGRLKWQNYEFMSAKHFKASAARETTSVVLQQSTIRDQSQTAAAAAAPSPRRCLCKLCSWGAVCEVKVHPAAAAAASFLAVNVWTLAVCCSYQQHKNVSQFLR